MLDKNIKTFHFLLISAAFAQWSTVAIGTRSIPEYYIYVLQGCLWESNILAPDAALLIGLGFLCYKGKTGLSQLLGDRSARLIGS